MPQHPTTGKNIVVINLFRIGVILRVPQCHHDCRNTVPVEVIAIATASAGCTVAFNTFLAHRLEKCLNHRSIFIHSECVIQKIDRYLDFGLELFSRFSKDRFDFLQITD